MSITTKKEQFITGDAVRLFDARMRILNERITEAVHSVAAKDGRSTATTEDVLRVFGIIENMNVIPD